MDFFHGIFSGSLVFREAVPLVIVSGIFGIFSVDFHPRSFSIGFHSQWVFLRNIFPGIFSTEFSAFRFHRFVEPLTTMYFHTMSYMLGMCFFLTILSFSWDLHPACPRLLSSKRNKPTEGKKPRRNPVETRTPRRGRLKRMLVSPSGLSHLLGRVAVIGGQACIWKE